MQLLKQPLVFGALFFVLASCGNSQTELDAAKKALLTQTATGQSIESASGEVIDIGTGVTDTVIPDIEIIQLSGPEVLGFKNLRIEDFQDGEAEISGETLASVDRIEVTFHNTGSLMPEDTYTLKTFQKGDASFVYRANSAFKVLDYGENSYIFRAYAGTQISETQIIVRLNEELTPAQTLTGSENQLIGDENNTLLLQLPTASKYGEPIRLGETSFTYSGIKGFEAEKKILPAVSCDALAQFLSESQTSYYYWNTCRDIVKEKGIKFNIIRLQGENYIYERHYIDTLHGLYGSVKLETGTGVNKDTIAEKNGELKDKIFPLIEVTDDLMKDIVNF